MQSDLQPWFETLTTFQQFDRQVIDQLREFVTVSPDEDLFRINPLAYAARMGLPERQAINLFVAAAHVGVFEISWENLCVMCGGVLREGRSPADLHHHVYCAACDRAVEVAFDDAIEVSFTISPRVRPIRFHQLDRLSDPGDLQRRFYSQAWTAGPEFLALMQEAILHHALQASGETVVHDFDLQPGTYQFVNIPDNLRTAIQVEGDRSESLQEVCVSMRRGVLTVSPCVLRPGPVRLKVESAESLSVYWHFAKVDRVHALAADIMAGRTQAVGPYLRPFLSGKRILSNQLFRELYRAVSVQPGSRFEIRSLTFLFTDLKGSTDLYDRIGDLAAYDLVQSHFQILADVVAEHDGAIVKTMGDAIMATFVSPADAVRAAQEMHDRLECWNRQHGERDLSLKVGVHTGGCIVVNMRDHLDYFGQTVNIAARIQGLAGSQETYFSEVVQSDPGVRDVLAEGKWELTRKVARLKGVSEEVGVFQATGISA